MRVSSLIYPGLWWKYYISCMSSTANIVSKHSALALKTDLQGTLCVSPQCLNKSLIGTMYLIFGSLNCTVSAERRRTLWFPQLGFQVISGL